jgi:hypothetical protein
LQLLHHLINRALQRERLEMIEIELSEPKKSICECCNKETTSLTRFVYKDGEAFAIYYAVFSKGHNEDGAIGIISLGDWGNDEVPLSRVAFAFRLWQDENNHNVTITDANESPWHNSKIIGKKLTRDEALSHPWIEDVFHITDHMVIDDEEIKTFLKGEMIH